MLLGGFGAFAGVGPRRDQNLNQMVPVRIMVPEPLNCSLRRCELAGDQWINLMRSSMWRRKSLPVNGRLSE